MRASVVVAVAGAVLLMIGIIMVVIGEVMRLRTPGGLPQLVTAGLALAVGGLALGVVLVVLAAVRPRRVEAGWLPEDRPGGGADEWLSPLRPVGPDHRGRPQLSRPVARTARAQGGPASAEHPRAEHSRAESARAEQVPAPFLSMAPACF